MAEKESINQVYGDISNLIKGDTVSSKYQSQGFDTYKHQVDDNTL